MVYTPTRPHAIYRLLIALDGVTPTVWRLLDVPATSTLTELHSFLQWAMGWEKNNPYYFYRGELAYTELPTSEKWSLGPVREAGTIALEKIFGRRGRYLEYIYDLDANWRHHIWLEEVSLARALQEYPWLLDGANACPPEVFDNADHYQAFLDDALSEAPTLPSNFDPDYFDAHPRPFPEAEILVFDESDYDEDQPIPQIDVQALDMLGDLASQTLGLIESAPEDLQGDLTRAIEDLILAEDCLPPQTKDTFDRAIEEGLPIPDLLINLITDHDELRARYSLAPLYAAWLLSFWPLPLAIEATWNVLKGADPDQEGTVDTMIGALKRSRKGRELLQNQLHTLDEALQLPVIEALLVDGERDRRFLPILQTFTEKYGAQNPTAPYLLAFYGGPQAEDILQQALTKTLDAISGDRSLFGDEELREQAEYAQLLANMFLEAGGQIEPDQQAELDELEAFFDDDIPPDRPSPR